MGAFNVFVEGPVEPMGLPELASAMAQRYGLPAADLVARLQRGRFRVKSNLDKPTAERYRRDLEQIGARVVIEDAALSPTATPVAGVPVQSRAPALSLPPLAAEQAKRAPTSSEPRTFTVLGPQFTRDPAAPSTPPANVSAGWPPAGAAAADRPAPFSPPPANRPATFSTPPADRPATFSTPPANRPATFSTPPSDRPASLSTPPPSALAGAPSRPSAPPSSGLAAAGTMASRPAPQMASGLAAAYSEPAHSDLGALSDEASFSLASIDGHDEVPPEAMPPEAPIAVVNIAAKPKSETPRRKTASTRPVDLFAPPDAGDQELKVELADDEIADRAAKRASIPPETQPLTPSLLPSQRMMSASSQQMGASARPIESGAVAAPKPVTRVQFALVVMIALFVGFLPAHLLASSRERIAFAAIDRQLAEQQDTADTPEAYQLLDGARAKFLDAKDSKRSSIALQSMLLWALISTGLGVGYIQARKRQLI